MCVSPGLYEVTFGFFSRRKPTVKVLVNSEPVLTLSAPPVSALEYPLSGDARMPC